LYVHYESFLVNRHNYIMNLKITQNHLWEACSSLKTKQSESGYEKIGGGGGAGGRKEQGGAVKTGGRGNCVWKVLNERRIYIQ
jgi:hypothetical protein